MKKNLSIFRKPIFLLIGFLVAGLFLGCQQDPIDIDVDLNAEKDDVESLFERVDIALYMAKENGRNRVEKA